MTSAKTEVAVIPPVRPIAYIIGLVFVAIIIPIMTFFTGIINMGYLYPFSTNVYSGQNWQQINYVFFWPFIILLITGAIGKATRLTKQEIVVIVSMIWVTWFIPNAGTGVKQSLTWNIGARLLALPWFPDRFMNDMNGVYQAWRFWGPDPTKAAVFSGALGGGASVPWGEWAFAMTYQSLYNIFFFATQIFLVNLFRRQWLDVEELPFPMATAGAQLINQSVEPSGGKSILKSVYLWVGIIVGFLGNLPLLLPKLTPAFADPPEPGIGVELTTLRLLPWVFLNFSVNPELIGAAYLMPTTILFSYLAFWVVFQLIWGPLMVSLGIWDPMPATSWHAYYGSLNRYSTGTLGTMNWAQYFGGTWVMFTWGAMAGLIIWPMLVYRREVMVVLKGLWGSVPKEIDENEPLKVKQTWIGFIVCFLATVFIYIWGTGGLLSSPFYWIPVILIVVGLLFQWGGLFMARYMAEVGYGMHPWAGYTQAPPAWNYSGWLYWAAEGSPWYMGSFTNPLASERRVVAAVRMYYSAGYGGTTHPLPSAFEAYKIGKETKTRYRDQFIGMMIAIPVAIVLTYIMTLTFAYTWGINNKWSAPYAEWSIGYFLFGWMGWGPPALVWCCSPFPTYTIFAAIAIGFAIVVLLFQLRARYPRWPFHPIAFPLVVTGMYPQMFLPIIIAFIAKRLTLRFGGSEAYSKYGVPIAIGLIIGFSINAFIGSLGIARIKGIF